MSCLVHLQEDNVYDVVDGKQRLTTLIFFSDPENFKSADGVWTALVCLGWSAGPARWTHGGILGSELLDAAFPWPSHVRKT